MQKIQLFAVCMLFCMAATAQNITKAEYFIDTDLGFGNNRVVSFANPAADTTYDFTIDLTGVSTGYHKLYIRTLSSENHWSHTTRQVIEVINGGTYVLKGAEFFFDTDPGFGNATAINFNPGSVDSSITFKIPLSQIPVGAKTLYLRTRDSENKSWSITQWEKDSVITSSGLDSVWSHPATWSNGQIPDSNTVVILCHRVIVDTDTAVCKSLVPYRQPANCIIGQGMKLAILGKRNQ